MKLMITLTATTLSLLAQGALAYDSAGDRNLEQSLLRPALSQAISNDAKIFDGSLAAAMAAETKLDSPVETSAPVAKSAAATPMRGQTLPLRSQN